MENKHKRLDYLVKQIKKKKALNSMTSQERSEKIVQCFKECEKKLKSLGIDTIKLTDD